MRIFAVAEPLIDYAAQVKQYSCDVCVGLLLGWMAIRIIAATSTSGQKMRWMALTLSGAIGIWFSHPAIFVLGGIGLTLLFASVQKSLGASCRWCC